MFTCLSSIYLSIFNSWAHGPLVSNASFTFFCILVFSCFLICSCVVGFFCVFLYNRSICTLSFDPLLLTLDEFEACDWLWCIHLTKFSVSVVIEAEYGCAWNRNLYVFTCRLNPLVLYLALRT